MKPVLIRLLTLLRKPACWSILLLLLLAVTVWFTGPSIAVNGTAIWAPPFSRVITIAALLLPWLGWQAIRYYQQRPDRRSARTADTEAIHTRIALEQRHQLNQQLLADRGISRRQQKRWPWLVLLGPAAAGKSSLFNDTRLAASRSTAASPTSGYGHSPVEWHNLDHCSWLETTAACLPDAEQGPPSAAWQALLGLLRQRAEPAISGVALILPVDLLLDHNPLELDLLARRYRRALSELRHALGLDLPVFLLLSKADLLPGITELSQQLPAAQREQPFGVTLPAASEPNSTLSNTLAPLLSQLHRQVLYRIQQEPDSTRRGRIYDLPYQLAKLEGPLRSFLSQAVDSNSYQQGSRLHGVYLTVAGNQHQIAHPGDPSEPVVQPAFVKQLVENTLLARSGGVTITTEHQRRQRARHRLVTGIAAACITVCTAIWALQYDREAEQLQQLAQLGQHFTTSPVRIQAHTRIEPLLQQLDTRYAATLIPQPSHTPSSLHQLSLQQSAVTLPVVREAYAESLQVFLVPLILRQLEHRLHTDLNDRQKLIGHLRAYLMLSLPDRRDSSYLQNWMRSEWLRRYPAQPEVRQSLDAHLTRLLAAPLQAQTVDDALIADTRALLLQEPLAQLCYRLLLEQSRSLPSYRLDTRLGRHHQLLAPRPVEIPGFYVKAGYESLLRAKGPALINDLLADDWVLGSGTHVRDKIGEQLLAELEAMYFQDYTEHWIRALASLQLKRLARYDAPDDLAALSSADSPLLALLQQIRLHTGLISNGETNPSRGKQALQQHFSQLHQLLDETATPQAELAQVLQNLGALQLQLAQLEDASTRGLLAFKMASARMQRRNDAISATRNSAAPLPAPLQGWIRQLADQSWQSVLASSADYLNSRYRNDVYAPYKEALADHYPFSPSSQKDVELGDFKRFFQREGTIQRFTSQYLEPFLISTGGGYRLRLVDGRALPLSAQLLAQLNQANAIHNSFFAADPFEPSVGFRLEPYSLDASLGRASFDYGNQQLEYRHGPIVPMAFRWPAPLDDSRVTLTLEDLGGRRMSLQQHQGIWSLFRLLDQMTLERQEQRDALQLRASIGGMRAHYLLHSQRSPNPFAPGLLAGFNLPASL